ncbi:MAG: hypothetical protein JJ896_14020 [Rhodothermales bacterium]|nr:hypothetical protein [Rhodothermales bacterium]MBO6780767.1 hypothetical protein [Rhodothermales bacterium]
MKRFGVGLLTAFVLLAVANKLMDPVPIAAATAVFGGLIALWTTRAGAMGWLVVGTIIGLALGVVHHLYIHNAGLSPQPADGVPAHLAQEGAVALGIAVAILAVVNLIDGRLTRQQA